MQRLVALLHNPILRTSTSPLHHLSRIRSRLGVVRLESTWRRSSYLRLSFKHGVGLEPSIYNRLGIIVTRSRVSFSCLSFSRLQGQFPFITAYDAPLPPKLACISRRFLLLRVFATAFISCQHSCFAASDITYNDIFHSIHFVDPSLILSLLPTSFCTARDGPPSNHLCPAHADARISKRSSFQRTTCHRLFRFSRSPRSCRKYSFQQSSCICSPLLPPPRPQHRQLITDLDSTRLGCGESSPHRLIRLE